MHKPVLKLTLALLTLTALGAQPALARDHRGHDPHHTGDRHYTVTLTNLMLGESITPVLVAVHRPGVRLFEPGMPASPELSALAEGGNTGPFTMQLNDSKDVKTVFTSPGLLDPGHSKTIQVTAHGDYDHLTMAAMLIPTNDGFFALQDVRLPRGHHAAEFAVPAYDAGSEPNDELCVDIPGPVCGGTGESPDAGGEGFVHIHPGIHGVGDLAPASYDWKNPVLKIVIKRAGN